MASFNSSSPLPLFIDTNLDTHLSFTIDGHESIAQLKGRIISEHANCFPQIGKISVEAVKAKYGEFFYHLSDSMIFKYFFQIMEVDKLQIDIVPASSTVKSFSQTKTITDACMDKRQLEKVEHLNCNGGHEASVQFDAKMKKKADSSDLKRTRKKKKEVSINEENPLVDDSLQKISGTASENPPKEILPEETISNNNDNGNNSNKSKMVQFVTSMKDSSDLKPKRKKKKKVTSNEEKPLVDDSLQKINDTAASENPPKEIFRTDTISNSNDNGNNSNKFEILASFNELSYHNNLQLIQSLVQATVDDKHNRFEKFVEVPPAQTKLVNSTLGDATAEVIQVKKYSLGKMGSEKVHLGTNFVTAVEHGDSSMGKVDDASHKNQIKMDIGAHMERKPPETDVDMNRNCMYEAPVQLDTNTSMKYPSDLKRKRKKKKKVSSNEELPRNPLFEGSLLKVNDTRAENQPKEIFAKETINNSNDFENESGSVLNNSNRDGLAPPFNNSGSGSNKHDPEKADSGSRAKVDLNIRLG